MTVPYYDSLTFEKIQALKVTAQPCHCEAYFAYVLPHLVCHKMVSNPLSTGDSFIPCSDVVFWKLLSSNH